MPKVRSIQLKTIHQSLFHAAQDWSSIRARTLLRYVFHQGITHALTIEHMQEAQSLLLDFAYALDRMKECTAKSLMDCIQDFAAVHAYQKDDKLALWIEFLKTNAHLLALETPTWSADRILFQRAMEHADQSPITHRAEEWIRERSCDWVWWRRLRRPDAIPIQPCVSTFLTPEEEWSSFGGWNDQMVAMDSGGMLWVWNRKDNEVLLQTEADDFSVQSKDCIVYWTEESIYIWTLEEQDSSLIHTSEEEIIDDVQWLGTTELLVTTAEGNLKCVHIDSSSCSSIVDFGDSRNLKIMFIDENTYIVYQDGWNDDAYEEYDEEYEDDHEADEGEEESEEYEDEEEYDEEYDEEDADDGEEEGDRPGDPQIMLFSRSDSNSAFESRELYTVENGLCTIQKMGSHVLIVDKEGTIFVVDSFNECLVHSWSVFEGTGADIYVLSASLFCVSQWNGEENFVLNLFSMDGFSVQTLEGHTDLVTSMRMLPSGFALSTSFDATAIIWDCETRTSLYTLHNSVPHDFSGSVVLDENTIALWSVSGEISIWDLRSQQQVGTLLGHTSSVSDVSLLPNGYLASSAMFEPSLRIWDPQKAPQKPPLDNHKDVIISEVYEQGSEVLTASHDETLRIWNRETAECTYVCTEHTKPLECMAWVGDGEIISGDWAGVLLHWNRNGDVLQRFEGHTDWIRGFYVVSESLLLSWSDDTTLRLWDRSSGDEVAVLEGHEDGVRGGFLLDENRWLSWSDDATLRIWDLDKHVCRTTFEGHGHNIDSVHKLDDNRILSYTREGFELPCEVKIWDVQTGECLNTYTGLDEEVVAWFFAEERVFVRTHSHCWVWEWEHPTNPVMSTFEDVQSTDNEIWQLLNAQARVSFGNDAFVTGKDNILSMNGPHHTVHWVAEGTWKTHKGFDNGLFLATCWKDIAFLQLYRGANPISPRELRA